MNRIKWLVTLLLLAGALGAVSWLQGFGADLKAVNDGDARALAGVAKAGLAVQKVLPGGLAEDLGLREGDVIHEVNGVRTLSPGDVQPALGDPSGALTVKFARAGRVRTSERGVLITGGAIRVAFVGGEASETLEMLRKAGMRVDCSSGIPEQLGPYQVIVIENDNACKPDANERIRAFLRRGGGIVLQGIQPILFAGASREYRYGRGSADLSSISDWLGAAEQFELSPASGYGDDWLFIDPVVVVASAFIDSPVKKGDLVWSRKGAHSVPFVYSSKLEPRAIDRAWANVSRVRARQGTQEADANTRNSRFCVAFTHEYGSGRVYWQFMPHEPNFPKLGATFVAGVRWVAQGAP